MKSDGGLRGIFRKHLPHVMWLSIETGFIEPGVPDLYGAVDYCSFWIENKKTEGYSVSVRPEQIGWHLRHEAAGCVSFVAVRRLAKKGPRRAPADELYLFDGKQIEQLSREGLSATLPLGVYSGGPARWDWEAIEGWLKTRPIPVRASLSGARRAAARGSSQS